MRYLVLVSDYDGTIAIDGKMVDAAVTSIERLRTSGRRAILVTGRRLADLLPVLPHVHLFDYIVAENGAVVYEPRSRRETLLADPPPPEFIQRLKVLGVPFDVGRVVVATWLPHHNAVLQAIQETGLELHVIFNRAAVMVLPTGVNKATGMEHALRKLGLSPHEAVGVGDAENDHSFLNRCECAVAVANAAPSIRKLAAFVTAGEAGHGVAELIDELIADDLSRTYGRLIKNLITIGTRSDGTAVTVAPYGLNILVAGPSGSGKSTMTAAVIERLMERTYQLCIVDPEGDYGTLPEVFTIGNQYHAVTVTEVLAFLEDTKVNINVNLLGIPLADRPLFFAQLLPNLQAMRTRTGRPHWIVLDEAHHMIPAEWSHLDKLLPHKLGETLLVTVHPDHLAPMTLSLVDVAIAVGRSPRDTLKQVGDALGRTLEWPEGLSHQTGKVVVWFPHRGEPPFSMTVSPGRAERLRHRRKYADGDMRDHSFYFRGPGSRQNLKAQNLVVFAQIADGVDEETWLFHLRQGDYSRWFRGAVKDEYLADQVERIEQRRDLQPSETRKLIRSLIEARYTLPE
ncbi:MAG TPA: HAD-IIB family hydrolase [Fimbriiglobus sp.]|nr:HAD-IIB family hydrolase [Fimbriiglobus sp.]